MTNPPKIPGSKAPGHTPDPAPVPAQDDLGLLRAALRTAPAAPAPDAKAAALALAMQNFDRMHQGTAGVPRPISDRPEGAGFLTGVRQMISRLTSRSALAATTSVAALCLGLVIVLPMLTPATNGPVQTELTKMPAVPATPATPDQPTEQPAGQSLQQPVAADQSASVPDSDAAVGTAAELDLAAQVMTAPVMAESNSAAPTLANPAQGSAAAVAGAVAGGVALPPAPPSAATAPSAVRSRMRAEGMAKLSDREAALMTAPAPGFATPMAEPAPITVPDTEAFASAEANPVKLTAEAPVSTFSVDVDTASYAVIRSSLMQGSLPPAEAVRIEEMVNYFPYAYAAPEPGEAPFRASATVMQTPWNPGTRLVRIGLQGRLPAVADRPALNLVFLIDTSGSMQDANKLPLLRQSLRLMLAQLRPEDQIAIVAYAGSAGEVLAPTRADNTAEIVAALDRLEAGGSTAGAEGLELAYRVAEKMSGGGEVSRVLLATDGDFNVGLSDPDGLEAYIAKQRDSGTYLSVLGFGRGNLDDATMQALAQAGNGQAAYIDTLQEARKVLVDQVSGALFPIADDVKIQVEWNPAQVAEYRLIGYETRALAREDFNNDKVDAGEIGAGHAVTALYEVTAPGSPALANDPLRYGAAPEAAPGIITTPTSAAAPGELGFLRLRYKAPGESTSALIELPIAEGTGTPDTEARFAAAIAGFGQLLTGGKYLGDWGWDAAIALALDGRGDDAFGYRVEAVNLMRLAQSLSPR